jgi:hypothetical protein
MPGQMTLNRIRTNARYSTLAIDSAASAFQTNLLVRRTRNFSAQTAR